MTEGGSPRKIHAHESRRKGLATPVSILIIFFSLTMTSTIAYIYAIEKIDARKEDLNVVAAEEKLLDLEEAISGVAWAVGSSRAIGFSYYGGELCVNPTGNPLSIDVTINGTIQNLFNGSVGLILYELPATASYLTGTWLLGDERPIVNSSYSHQAQVRIESGQERQEIVVSYRTLVSSSLGGLIDDRRVNSLRIYILNLNNSQSFTADGELFIRTLCSDIDNLLFSYNLSSSITMVSIRAELNGSEESVVVPISSGPSGSIVKIEVVVCHVEVGQVSV